jgi:hypothetical protein
MTDPLIAAAKKAVTHFHLPPVRVSAATAARLHSAAGPGASDAELELREAIRTLMMAMPIAADGTHGLIAAALSPLLRAFELTQKLRGLAAPAPKRAPYYMDRD